MFIYMTKPGDTIQSVAQFFYECSDEDHCKRLRDANHDRKAYKLKGQTDRLMPFYPLMIPGYGKELNKLTIKRMLSGIEAIGCIERKNITMAMRRGFNLHHAIGASRALNHHNQRKIDEGSHDAASIATFVGAAVRESGGRIAERSGHPAEEFSRRMDFLEESAKNYKDVLQSTSDIGSRQIARDVYKTAHREALVALDKAGNFYSHKRTVHIRQAIRGKNRLFKQVVKQGVVLEELADFSAFETIAKCSSIGGLAFMGIGIGLGIKEVYDTEQEGGDWVAKLVGVSAETAISIAAGSLLMACTPVGWVTLIGVGIAEGVMLSFLGNFYIEPKVESLTHRVEAFLAPYWHRFAKAQNEAMQYAIEHNVVIY